MVSMVGSIYHSAYGRARNTKIETVHSNFVKNILIIFQHLDREFQAMKIRGIIFVSVLTAFAGV